MQGIRLFFWNLDLWPETVSVISKYKGKNVTNFLEKIVKYIYKNSDKILISSKGFIQHSLEKGKQIDDLVYFPNWAEEVFIKDITEYKSFSFNIPQGFNIMYAGNIGDAQDIESVLKAIKVVSEINNKINWIFVGCGRKFDWFNLQIKDQGLGDNVFLLGHYPIDDMPHIYKFSDVMLVTLKNTGIFANTVPAKLQAYMASKKPIIAMINGECANIIKEANCGFACESGDYNSLAKNVLALECLPRKKISELGENGYNYYKDNFDKERIIDKLISLCTE
jgi:glycosyltransferase involved in cell wall biosynthesis